MTLSLILPCFNEEENIANTAKDACEWLKHSGMKGEVIIVDDGSTDGTSRVLDELCATYPELRIVRHAKNQGYGLAVRLGCDAATMDIIAFMDSDGQFKAKDLELLLVHLEAYPFVTGRRHHRADPLVRRIFGKILGLMNLFFFRLWVRDVNCGLKAFHKDIWPNIRPEHGVEKLFNTEVFLKLTQQKIPWLQVTVPHYPRMHGFPTGAKLSVIIRMFHELSALKKAQRGRATV